jgi:hypothetical protein
MAAVQSGSAQSLGESSYGAPTALRFFQVAEQTRCTAENIDALLDASRGWKSLVLWLSRSDVKASARCFPGIDVTDPGPAKSVGALLLILFAQVCFALTLLTLGVVQTT